ncbi:MAG: RsmB/NOP family class I SAM-dependent RNA methyltransferase [Deltaproteobacteria bacterium]|nr:RsmB/NOP family class I SAM-dependent RNA methyltransferase [Deltaproteobacteria bacterium]
MESESPHRERRPFRPLSVVALFDIALALVASKLRHADVAVQQAFRRHRGLGSKDRGFVADLAWTFVRQLDRVALALSVARGNLASPDATDPRWLNPRDAKPAVAIFLANEPLNANDQHGPTLLDDALAREPRFEAALPLPARNMRGPWRAVRAFVEAQRGDDHLAIELGYPVEFVRLLVADLGVDAARNALAAMNTRAPMTIRVNTLKANLAAARDALRAERIETKGRPETENALVITTRTNLYALNAFKHGLIEAQDEGSQRVAALVEAQPGESILDACAGAGGKTLALAAAMENRGRLVAVDASRERLAECERRATRAGATIVKTERVRPGAPWPETRVPTDFDAALVDAPCTGSGTLRRNPEMRWHLTGDWLTRFPAQQRAILDEAARHVRPGGRLIYATCSLLRCENEAVATDFSADSQGAWTLDHTMRIDPATGASDGFFAARLCIRK